MCFRVTGLHFVTYMDCCCSVGKSCLTLFDPMKCIMPGFPVLHCLQSLLKPSYILLPPYPLAPSLSHIRVFSSESALHIRWPKYWSFSFSISPSKEYSWLNSFRIDLLAVQGTQESSHSPKLEIINYLALSFLYGPGLTSVHNY